MEIKCGPGDFGVFPRYPGFFIYKTGNLEYYYNCTMRNNTRSSVGKGVKKGCFNWIFEAGCRFMNN
jgi:hypothetical protein